MKQVRHQISKGFAANNDSLNQHLSELAVADQQRGELGGLLDSAAKAFDKSFTNQRWRLDRLRQVPIDHAQLLL